MGSKVVYFLLVLPLLLLALYTLFPFNKSTQCTIVLEKPQIHVNITGSFKIYSAKAFKELLGNCTRYLSLVSPCIENHTLNVVCASFYLRQYYNFSYKRERGDVLLSVDDFVRQRGGDCEDWSLFFVCLYRHPSIVKLKYATQGNCTIVVYKEVHEGEVIQYTLNGFCYKEIPLNEYPYTGVACYSINESLGHCVTIISKNPIVPTHLREYILIDPQTGTVVQNVTTDKIYILFSDTGLYVKIWDVWS